MASSAVGNQPESLYRPKGALDVLSLPLIGRLLKWRWGRLTLQAPLFIVALLLIYDGFTGPDLAARNLATVAPWVHYRGIVVVALLLAGNLFCMGCPFTVPRTLGKRFSLSNRRFPRILRNKWLAILSLFVIFFLYEWLDLWSSPALTAWVIVAYFVGSFALEATFGESAFCKYVCPLGTFNFVYSTASPTQITAKNLDVCKSCVGKECVNGSYSAETVIRLDMIPTMDGGTTEKQVVHSPQRTPGCGLDLFVPQIKTNLDCTLCLDCVRACPHDNVALMTRTPGRELLQPDAWRKGWDISFLVISLTFLGMLNAFGMIGEVQPVMQDIARTLRLREIGFNDFMTEGIVLLILFVVFGVIVPAMLTLGAATITRTLTRTEKKYSLRESVAAFAPAFVPLGFGIWIAHYGFHFLTGALTIIPVFQNFVLDHRIDLLGQPDWTLSGMSIASVNVLQVIVMIGTFFWSVMIAQRIALRMYRRDGMMALLPWALLFLAIAYFSVQIFGQDMEMRGTLMFQ
ncbi:MAG: hypothetical protein RLP44_10160 [Aggregatilineales bacterium]